MAGRNLSVTTKEEQSKARKALQKVGYYRLSGYMPVFQVGGDGADKHDFLPGTTLTKILDLYKFDTDLRGHLSSALERIEVAFRTSVCDHMCRATGDSHWLLNPANFRGASHAQHLEKFKSAVYDQSQNSEFVKSYFDKYDDPFLPPAWMMRECASFGAWSKLFSDLATSEQKSISDEWTYPAEPGKTAERIDHMMLEKWMHSMVLLRNRCAHHGRIINRIFSFLPPDPSNHPSVKHLFLSCNTDLRTLIVIISIFLKNVDPRNIWLRQLYLLLDTYDDRVDIAKATGFSNAWQTDALWNF